MPEQINRFPQLQVPWFLLTALAIGMAYGLIEAGTGMALSEWKGTLGWRSGTSIDALLYSPMVYGIAYVLFSLPFVLLSRAFQRIPWDAAQFWFLVVLSGYLLAGLMSLWFSEIAAMLIGLGLGTLAGRWYLARRDGRALLLRRAAPVPIVLALVLGVGLPGGQRAFERAALGRLAAADPKAPNVILMVLDTERGDHLTSYGYDRPTTPRLAALARKGAVFTWALSPAPTTLPSHAGMFTGQRVADHRAGVGGRRYLDGRYPTIAEVVRDQGYATAGFVANIFWTGRPTGLARGFMHYEDYFGTGMDRVTRTVLGQSLAYILLPRLGMVDIPGRKHAGTINDELLRWLNQIPSDRPFFAFLNYMDVHAPYLPPAEYLGRISDPRYKANQIEIGAWNEHDHLPSPEVLGDWRDRYDESLMYLDHEIGSLMDSLGTRGLLENTVVIVTADHGESFGEHGMVHHGGGLYLEQIRVPLLIWGAGIPSMDERVDTPVDLRSLPATIADVVGANQAKFPGHSLLQYLDSIPDSRPAALTEGPEVSGNPVEWQTGRGWVISMVKERWHLLVLQSGVFELYDIIRDPTELKNLADSPEHREILMQLRRDLEPALATASVLQDGREAN